MKLKRPEEIIKSIYDRYSVKEENIIFLGRLFVAASVVRWAFKQSSKTEELLQYLSQVEKFLEGEIDLYWQDGVIKVGRNKKGDK
jgi:hypothetical protein